MFRKVCASIIYLSSLIFFFGGAGMLISTYFFDYTMYLNEINSKRPMYNQMTLDELISAYRVMAVLMIYISFITLVSWNQVKNSNDYRKCIGEITFYPLFLIVSVILFHYSQDVMKIFGIVVIGFVITEQSRKCWEIFCDKKIKGTMKQTECVKIRPLPFYIAGKVSNWFNSIPLFLIIIIWEFLAFGLLTFLIYLWTGEYIWSRFNPGINLFDVLKVAITAIGGIGGVAFLVMKYRDNCRDERTEVSDKINKAIEQLGSDKAQIRVAAVYALSDIADAYKGGYRQRVVDILCGYLRSPRNIITEAGDQYSFEKDDRAVESAIFKVFDEHLMAYDIPYGNGRYLVSKQSDQLWCDLVFDLRGATIVEDFNLIGPVFAKIILNEATFYGKFFLYQPQFKDKALFDETKFKNDFEIDFANIWGMAYFDKAEFNKSFKFNAVLTDNLVKHVTFKDAIFNKDYINNNQVPDDIVDDNDLPCGAKWMN